VSGRTLIAGAVAASALLVAVYLAAGGGSYEPTPVADPCASREWSEPEGVEGAAQQFLLSALDGAACELGVSRETLAAALATEESRQEFAAEQGIDEAALEEAVRAGVVRAIDDAEAANELNPVVADGLRALAVRLPVDEAVALIDDAENVLGDVGGVIDDIGGAVDQLGDLVP
jgi:translation elongation factor EF-1beta